MDRFKRFLKQVFCFHMHWSRVDLSDPMAAFSYNHGCRLWACDRCLKEKLSTDEWKLVLYAEH